MVEAVANSSNRARVPREERAPKSSPLAHGFASTRGLGAHSSSGALPWRLFPRHTAFVPPQVSSPAPAPASYPAPSGWDQVVLIATLNQMALQGANPWVPDTGATSHKSSNDGILLSRLPHSSSYITVGNGSSIPICSRGTSTLSIADHIFQLNNVLVAPHLVRNLLSVRQLTRDNNCSIEFDAFGFSVKDPKTRTVILRCNSDGDLYTIPSAPPPTTYNLIAASASLWHSRLGHPAPAAIASLNKMSAISCKILLVVFVMLAS